jgi:hypothetical protein
VNLPEVADWRLGQCAFAGPVQGSLKFEQLKNLQIRARWGEDDILCAAARRWFE